MRPDWTPRHPIRIDFSGFVRCVVAAFRRLSTQSLVLAQAQSALPGVQCALPGGAFYAFPNIRGTRLDSRALQSRLLEQAGVATLSGTSFGAFGEGYLRLSYAASLSMLSEAVRRIGAFLEQPARVPLRAASVGEVRILDAVTIPERKAIGDGAIDSADARSS
jgi:hypothetical protein